MSYCVNPECYNPENSEKERVCRSCGNQILLKDRYLPIKPIGQGGFGRTFLAIDRHIPSQPTCVIKQLSFPKGDPSTFQKVVSLFRQEAIRLNQLGKHPQIPQLLAYFEQQQNLYLVQELISGKTLADELLNQGVYNETQIWELLKDVLPILQFIHEHQVIHRDIKPANIIRRFSDNRLVLIDFGVAKLFSNVNLFETGTIIGSPQYMPPEQTRGKVLPCSDLYSLGVSCIFLLTNVSPLDMFDIIEQKWLWRSYLPPGISVSDRLASILNKLIENSIKERYQSAEEALQAVNTKPTVVVKPQKTTGDNLASEVGINYQKLRQLLAARRWKEADDETWLVMCKAVGKSPGSYIFPSDISRFPLQDLQTIDQLWLHYSYQHFGFSIQKQIYESVGNEYNLFCDRIGWTTHQSAHANTKIQFTTKAPLGHLPSRRSIGGLDWWRHAEAMAKRLDNG